MKRLSSICKHTGCNTLITAPGYCDKHKLQERQASREAWNRLTAKKTPEEIKFYSSAIWATVRSRHRKKEPLCRRCKAQGRIVQGTLVHHNPSYKELIATGRNPYLDDYLETLCTSCHNKELRNKH